MWWLLVGALACLILSGLAFTIVVLVKKGQSDDSEPEDENESPEEGVASQPKNTKENSEVDPDQDNVIKNRNRLIRGFVGMLCAAGTVFGPAIAAILIYGILSYWILLATGYDLMSWKFLVCIIFSTFAPGAHLLTLIGHHFYITVPVYQGAVTDNVFKRGPKKATIYGPGVHWKYPWERMHGDRHISLQDRTHEFKQDIPAKGALIAYKGNFQWKPQLARLDVFYGRGESTINLALTGKVEAFISSLVSQLTVIEAPKAMRVLSFITRKTFEVGSEKNRNPNLLSESERELYERLMEKASTDPNILKRAAQVNKELHSLENDYGITVLDITIYDIILPKAVQRTLNAVREMADLVRIAMIRRGWDPEKEEHQKLFEALPAAERDTELSAAERVSGQGTTQRQDLNLTGNGLAGVVGMLMSSGVIKTDPDPADAKTGQQQQQQKKGGGGGGGRGKGGGRK
jgi:hypothetical protein